MVDNVGKYPYGGYGFGSGLIQLIFWLIFIWILLIALGFIFRPIVY